MSTTSFKLHPFDSKGKASALAILGQITRQGNLLTLTYVLSGDLDQVRIPIPSARPSREYRLWEETCFELFIGAKYFSPYWEVNLSPSGSWNIFRFSDYRKNMAEETAVPTLPVRVTRQPDVLEIQTKISLETLLLKNQPIRAGASAVIKGDDGNLTFWTLAHPSPKPDFHCKGAFCIQI
jgi:hypothetical protein